MIRVFIVFLSFIGICIQLQAQSPTTLYFDVEGKITSQELGSFYSIIIRETKDTSEYTENTFYKTGKLKAKGKYRAQKFPVRWQNMHLFSFWDASREGAYTEYYPNGQIYFQGQFLNGLGEGKHQYFYQSGALLSEMQLIKGRENGKVTAYYENGNIESQYTATDGKFNGEALEYHIDGKKKHKTVFKDGVQVGEKTSYNANGEPLSTP